MTTLDTIKDALKHRRLAFVGLSTNAQDFSRALDRELAKHGYDVVPVNPNAQRIDGRETYSRIQEIVDPVQWVLVMTPPDAAADVVADAHAAGVNRVWLHRGVGQGSVSEAAVEMAKQHGMTLVNGECPLMFLGKPGFPHNVHAFFKKVARTYPKPTDA